ncbi:MAG: PhoH family protein, partial [Deltaproteobacteria bacterium]|nr:PhoH family protein [Deltaproteobacteria bacterium]
TLNAFYRDNGLQWPLESLPRPNEFLVLKSAENPSQSALARYAGNRAVPLLYDQASVWGISARNKEQRFALELLGHNEINVVTLVGSAGTGKTLLALAVGLEKVLDRKEYNRLLIMRPVVPMGDDLGYLPGTKDEKLRPWMQPIYDNLDYLFRGCRDSETLLDEFINRGVIEMETLTYIRGRSIPNQFIICDEAQNLTPNMIKTLITRVGEGTKIVFTGDPDQIDHPYLDAGSNGLSYMVERLKEEAVCGHVTLTRGERSEVAEMAARRL